MAVFRTIKKFLARKAVPMLVLAAAGGGLYAISTLPEKDRSAPPRQQSPVMVATTQVAQLTRPSEGQVPPQLRDAFVLLGTVMPNRVVTVSAEGGGTVISKPVEKGTKVKAGETVLVELDDSECKIKVARWQAQADLDEADLKRLRSLPAGIAAAREYFDAEAKLRVSQAELASAKLMQDRCRIVAPIDGYLDTLPVEKGQLVKVGDAVASIVDTSVAKVQVEVPARDIGFLKPGDEQEIRYSVAGQDDNAAQRSVTGKIRYISQVSDARTHTTCIEVAAPNPTGEIRSGMPVQVNLTRRIMDKLISVPLSAVIPQDNGYAVFVLEGRDAQGNDTASKRMVELGVIRTGDDGQPQVQILKGLSDGDLLVVQGQRYVADGQTVKAQQAAAGVRAAE